LPSGRTALVALGHLFTERPPERRFRRGNSVSTYTPRASEIERVWHVVDAEGLILGRMATEVASILRGKHKATFTPHMDTGDHVVIVNSDKVVLTGAKATDKMVYDHSGYPGGLSSRAYGDVLSNRSDEAVRRTIRGMLPKNRLGRQMINKLKVYRGPEHPHEAQQPQPLVIEHARARTS
jgi:large subunit ribosomal protein L13|tara:strand:+ start:3833 stop:4372 length:540 start_codon:yes stop_codon:yes gene_type:complete